MTLARAPWQKVFQETRWGEVKVSLFQEKNPGAGKNTPRFGSCRPGWPSVEMGSLGTVAKHGLIAAGCGNLITLNMTFLKYCKIL